MLIKFNKKIVIGIIVAIMIASVIALILGDEPFKIVYGVILFVFIVDFSNPGKYDFIFTGVLVIGVILDFTYMFYKNVYIINTWSVVISCVALWTYLNNVKIK